ncbi:aldehyde:ferredoxin oxidoreductase [Tindallia magadiensis]|uniref:Aldehyde:ferredoxin oxidoreductase n=1 Tax=Tindallia magadiensis TaxID=69895 RepID=A0A1I3EM77_9FIRM|nr:aldehyde ferredoxin oxidoreductase family protein [Tindallia magadiensis]SFI00115.1 aldehyde:ferredoxin oxidoreductase [Tindallia magadiensis]
MSAFPDAKVLEVDLTSGTINKRSIPGDTYRLYPGGSALGLYLILQEMEPGVDPLSPDNMLVFSTSMLTGLPISGQSRVMITTKSPLTDTIGDSQAGGFFPAHLRNSGYDAVVLKGKAEKPVYLYIDGDEVTIKDASSIWGKVTGETEAMIRKELGEDQLEIAEIGPAGENLVKYAAIMNMANRANGRNGTGAVMGSKNLKAIAVKKVKPRKAYDPVAFKELNGNVKERIEENPNIQGLSANGTNGELAPTSEEGFLPTRNFLSGYFGEKVDKIDGTAVMNSIFKESDTCFACAIRCKRVVEIEGKVDPLYGGPEYETAATFGSYCDVDNLEDVSIANQYCNMYGLDTISCGATIAFAMECYEKGLLSKEETDGMDLSFGRSENFADIIEKISLRQGFGDLLAEGTHRMAEKIGPEAMALSMCVKKQELPAHMPHYKPAIGLLYAVNSFGADHQSCEHDPFLTMPEDSFERKRLAMIGIDKGYEDSFAMDDNKVKFTIAGQKFFSTMDTLGLCQFAWGPTWQLYGPDDMVDLCKAGVGWNASIEELLEVGERRINMMRYFNMREGFCKKDDYLPERMFEPLTDGPQKGFQFDKDSFLEFREKYYQMMDWNEDGNPTDETLKKLSLDWLLEKR